MPLLPVLAAFVVGEILMRHTGGLVLYGAVFLAAFCIFAWWRKWFRAASCALFALIGMIAGDLASLAPVHYGADSAGGVRSGRVEDVAATPYNQRLAVKLDSGGKVLAYYHAAVPPLMAGDVVAFNGELRPIDDGVVVPGEISMGAYAFRNGIGAYCDIEDGALHVIGFKDSLSAFFSRIRGRVSDFIHGHSGLPSPAAAMLDAVLLGNAGELVPEVRERFATAGVAHVLALSGTHVAVIAFMVSLLLFPLRMAGHNRVGSMAVVVLLWGYVFLTGCSPSVVRTVIMVSVVLVGRLLRRGSCPLNNLCLAALLILLFDPMALYAPGFQLSFAAVAGILMFAFELMPGGRLPFGVRSALQWLAVCFSAVIATSPLAAWHFHQLPLCFLLANLPVGLVMPWFMGGGVLLVLLQCAGADAGWLVAFVEGMYDVIIWIVSHVASLPGASLDGIYFSAWLLVPCYAAILLVWLALIRRRMALALGGLLLLVFTAGCLHVSRPSLPGIEAYGVRYHYATVLLLREGQRGWILTDAPHKFHPVLRERMEKRFEDFMGYRDIDSLEVVTELSICRAFYANASYWAIGDRLITVAGNNCPPALDDGFPRPVYAVITRGFKGDVTYVDADTIVLSRALHQERIDCLASRLDEAGRAYRIGLEGRLLH